MIHSANPQSWPAEKICFVLVELHGDVQTDGQTTLLNIGITIGRDCGRLRGSKRGKSEINYKILK